MGREGKGQVGRDARTAVGGRVVCVWVGRPAEKDLLFLGEKRVPLLYPCALLSAGLWRSCPPARNVRGRRAGCCVGLAAQQQQQQQQQWGTREREKNEKKGTSFQPQLAVVAGQDRSLETLREVEAPACSTGYKMLHRRGARAEHSPEKGKKNSPSTTLTPNTPPPRFGPSLPIKWFCPTPGSHIVFPARQRQPGDGTIPPPHPGKQARLLQAHTPTISYSP